MMKDHLQQFGRILDRLDIGGWSMLFAGIGLIVMTFLTPAYLTNQALNQRRAHLQQQFDRLDNYHNNYQEFVTAINHSDPILVTRLAWHLQHLKPKGRIILDDLSPAEPGATQHFEQWMGPLPMPIDSPTTEVTIPNTMLTRLTSGRSRVGLITLGACLILASLLSGTGILGTSRRAVLINEPDHATDDTDADDITDMSKLDHHSSTESEYDDF